MISDKFKGRTHRLVIAVCTAAIAAISSGPASAQGVELIFNSYLPHMNVTHRIVVADFAARIEAESGGEISVIIPDATLAPAHQQYEMLLDGVADIAFSSVDNMAQMVSLNAIAGLPFNAPTAEAASVALWETYKEYFEPLAEYRGVKVLSTHALRGRELMTFYAPADSASAMANVKFWVPNGLLTEIVQSTGAVPVHANFPQLFETVTRGMVDGLVITPGSAASADVMDRVRYYTSIPGGLGSVAFAVMISEERWNELTEPQQAAILRAAEGLPRRAGASNDVEEIEALDAMDHVTVVDAPAALLSDLSGIFDLQINDWKERARAKGLADPDAALDFYRAVLERETSQ